MRLEHERQRLLEENKAFMDHIVRLEGEKLLLKAECKKKDKTINRLRERIRQCQK